MKVTTSLLFILILGATHAQHKINLSAGIGYPSMLHGEGGYQYKKLELSYRSGGINIRTDGYRFEEVNIRYHFMKQRNMMVGNQHYWTTSMGIGRFSKRYRFYNGHSTIDVDPMLIVRGGHHFELSDRFNFSLMAGPTFDISSERYTDETYRLVNFSAAIKLQWELLQTEGW